jgi:hypothetical protein
LDGKAQAYLEYLHSLLGIEHQRADGHRTTPEFDVTDGAVGYSRARPGRQTPDSRRVHAHRGIPSAVGGACTSACPSQRPAPPRRTARRTARR